MDTDLPSLVTAWPVGVSAIGITGIVLLALRVAVASSRRTTEADRLTTEARNALRDTERELDRERDRRRRIEDEMTAQIRALRNEVAELRRQVAALGGA